MTFRSSLYLSLAVHLLIFGSAIAVAQYAGGYFVSPPHVIPVSLIALAPGPREGVESRQQQGLRSNDTALQAVDVMSEPEQVVPPELSADLRLASEVPEEAQAAGSDSTGNDAGTDVHGQAIASAAAGRDENLQEGSIVPQQWTAIQAAIERSKNYPRLAREQGIEGEVRLRFKLNSSGSVNAVEVVRSSGYEILDSASIRALYRAAPMPSVRGWIEVPIAYVLK